MRFAYADPPYLGCGRFYTDRHPDARAWDTVDRHRQLILELTECYPDGWALSLSAKSLPVLLPECPTSVRVCAWVKPFCAFKKGVRVAYSWEPLIVYGGRRNGDPDAPETRDHLRANMAMRTGLVGAKPDRFNRWVLDLLGYVDGVDTIDDLFPGTGGMSRAVAAAPFPRNGWAS